MSLTPGASTANMDLDDSSLSKQNIYTDDADLIIIDRSDNKNYVSSKILMASSTVFRAMFRPCFSEGQSLLTATGDSLPVIQLPDDNASAMSALFCVLHGVEPASAGIVMDIMAIQELGKVADKYQCTSSLASISSTLFADIEATAQAQQTVLADTQIMRTLYDLRLIRAAWLVDNAEYFQKYTNILVRTGQTAEIFKFGDQDEEELRQACRQRDTDCRKFLFEQIALVVQFLQQQSHPSSHQQTRRGGYEQQDASRYLEELVSSGLWPKSSSLFRNLGSMVQAIDWLQDPEIYGIESSQIRKIKKIAQNMWTGLCLDCFKHPAGVARKCRIPHWKFSLKPGQSSS